MAPERRYALIAGFAYLAMTVIALSVLVDTSRLPALLTADSVGAPWPAATARALGRQLIGLAIVVGLDLLIAWALYALWRADRPVLAGLMALTQVIYAVIFAYALTHVAAAWQALRTDLLSTASLQRVMAELQAFQAIWDGAFVFFSAHLILLGALVRGPGPWRKGLGILLIVAGLGYLADSLLAFGAPDTAFRFAPYTFVGEMLFMLWLLFAAGRRGPPG